MSSKTKKSIWRGFERLERAKPCFAIEQLVGACRLRTSVANRLFEQAKRCFAIEQLTTVGRMINGLRRSLKKA
jgi:hypothetical protein